MKWAKNLQKTEQSHVVMIPKMGNSWLCPSEALLLLFKSQKYSPKDPVLKSLHSVFTESMLRRRLALILKLLQLPHETLTFHCLRRSGAFIAFNNNVSMEGIKNQGAWSSDSVYQYLFANSHRISEVPKMFQVLEHTVKGS